MAFFDPVKHNHGRRMKCPPGCPREGMSDGPCAICGSVSDPVHLVCTGGGCDYPVCSEGHGSAVWLALEVAQAVAENPGLPVAPWPIAHAPDWVPDMDEGDRLRPGTVADLEAYAKRPAVAKALKAQEA